MFTDPMMYTLLAESHRRQLLRDAEGERLARLACADQPTLFTHMRLGASAVLFALGRLLQPRGTHPVHSAKHTQSQLPLDRGALASASASDSLKLGGHS